MKTSIYTFELWSEDNISYGQFSVRSDNEVNANVITKKHFEANTGIVKFELISVQEHDVEMKLESLTSYKLERIRAELDNFNKKHALKLGCKPFTLEVIREYIVKERTNGGYGEIIQVQYFEVLVKGDYPKIGDYEVAGYTEHFKDGNNMVYNVKATENELTKYRNTITCEHCNHNRYRAYTWILRNTITGELKQVGTTCVKDYTGHDPSSIIRMIAYYRDMVQAWSDEPSSGGRSSEISIRWCVAAVVYLTGTLNMSYVSKSKAMEVDQTATAHILISKWFFKPYTDKRTGRTMHFVDVWGFDILPSDSDYEKADTIIAWAKDHPSQADYWYSVKTLLSNTGDLIDSKYTGYLASIPAAHHREVEAVSDTRNNGKSEKTAAKISEHVGQIKERLELTLTLNKVFSVDTNFGIADIMLFSDEQGNVFKWFTTSAAQSEWPKDAMFRVKATIKDHCEYKGVKQTAINRVKLIGSILPLYS